MDQRPHRIAVSDQGERSLFVSVIVPMRNEERYIGQCLDSLLNQDYNCDRYEIMVVNEKSAYDPRRIVEKKGRHFDRVRLLTNPHQTTPHGFNIGIRESKGEETY